jgi:hypothetical protein
MLFDRILFIKPHTFPVILTFSWLFSLFDLPFKFGSFSLLLFPPLLFSRHMHSSIHLVFTGHSAAHHHNRLYSSNPPWDLTSARTLLPSLSFTVFSSAFTAFSTRVFNSTSGQTTRPHHFFVLSCPPTTEYSTVASIFKRRLLPTHLRLLFSIPLSCVTAVLVADIVGLCRCCWVVTALAAAAHHILLPVTFSLIAICFVFSRSTSRLQVNTLTHLSDTCSAFFSLVSSFIWLYSHLVVHFRSCSFQLHSLSSSFSRLIYICFARSSFPLASSVCL